MTHNHTTYSVMLGLLFMLSIGSCAHSTYEGMSTLQKENLRWHNTQQAAITIASDTRGDAYYLAQRLLGEMLETGYREVYWVPQEGLEARRQAGQLPAGWLMWVSPQFRDGMRSEWRAGRRHPNFGCLTPYDCPSTNLYSNANNFAPNYAPESRGYLRVILYDTLSAKPMESQTLRAYDAGPHYSEMHTRMMDEWAAELSSQAATWFRVVDRNNNSQSSDLEQ